VQYNAALKYLLVILDNGCSREDLEAVVPDAASMSQAVGGEHLVGVIVTTQGTCREGWRELMHDHLHYADCCSGPAAKQPGSFTANFWGAL
jgi:hypothetical protein